MVAPFPGTVWSPTPLFLPTSLWSLFQVCLRTSPLRTPPIPPWSSTVSQERSHWPWIWWAKRKALKEVHCSGFLWGTPLSPQQPPSLRSFLHSHPRVGASSTVLGAFISTDSSYFHDNLKMYNWEEVNHTKPLFSNMLSSWFQLRSGWLQSPVLSTVQCCLQNRKTNETIASDLGYNETKVLASFSFYWHW